MTYLLIITFTPSPIPWQIPHTLFDKLFTILYCGILLHAQVWTVLLVSLSWHKTAFAPSESIDQIAMVVLWNQIWLCGICNNWLIDWLVFYGTSHKKGQFVTFWNGSTGFGGKEWNQVMAGTQDSSNPLNLTVFNAVNLDFCAVQNPGFFRFENDLNTVQTDLKWEIK